MTWHLITTQKWPFHIQVRKLRHALQYIDVVHIRDKESSLQRLKQQIDQLCKIGLSRGQMILNEHVEAAAAWDLGGVHLSSHSTWNANDVKEKAPHLQVGVSVHSRDEALARAEEGADYLYYGHVYRSSSKPGEEPRGLAALQSVVQAVPIPVLAIGGITRERITEISQTGAAGIAMISSFWDAEDVEEEARYFRNFKQVNYETT
ncbi:thiazole tautomerase (transcriptional regulator TenI) [Geomicrobium halophilum]|uniref:Thiazole tautomerase (Transcriptional regulator TenI) n=1 Tax=Geomicrobium halophilum TaxID=549000 RepID=A0A841PSV5_9BACL|nr:thiamine phosphate synthase [Geomicrobium halophilum]MBB6450276.1 thiazole tautomerase (transcriptional regulator TenI) [Geomicrobium halophilum]